MKGFFQWVRNKASSLYSGAQAVVTTTIDVAVIVYEVVTAKSVLDGLSANFKQAWRGFASVLDPSVLVTLVLSRPDSRKVMKEGIAASLSRLVPVLFYNAGVRPLVGTALKTVGCHPLIETTAVSILDVAAIMYFTRNTVRGFADTAACNMAIAKTTAVESYKTPEENLPHNPLMHACPESVEDKLLASVNSSYYYFTNSVLLHMLSSAIPYGEYVTLPLYLLFYGRSLLEIPLADNCTEHRLEVLNKNNPYALGLGFSYWLSLSSLKLAADYGLNSRGFFVNESLAALLYLFYVVAIQYNRETPLPGEKPGPDYFYHSRILADVTLQKTWNWLQEHYKDSKDKHWYAALKIKSRHVANAPLPQALSNMFVDPNLQDWQRAMQRDSAQLFLKHCGPGIVNGLEFVLDMRGNKTYKRINKYKDVAPQVMEEQRKKLSIIMDEGLKEPLNEWYRFFADYVDPQRVKKREERLTLEAQEKDDNIFANHDFRQLNLSPQLPKLNK